MLHDWKFVKSYSDQLKYVGMKISLNIFKIQFILQIIFGPILSSFCQIGMYLLGLIHLMPCSFTGPKMFCAGPNFLNQPKKLVPLQKNLCRHKKQFY